MKSVAFPLNRCHGCGMQFAADEHFVSVDLNIGACAAGAGNWVKYHSTCAPITFHGPMFGKLVYELNEAQWEQFLKHVDEDREPTERAKRAAARYKLMVTSK